MNRSFYSVASVRQRAEGTPGISSGRLSWQVLIRRDASRKARFAAPRELSLALRVGGQCKVDVPVIRALRRRLLPGAQPRPLFIDQSRRRQPRRSTRYLPYQGSFGSVGSRRSHSATRHSYDSLLTLDPIMRKFPLLG